MKLRYNYSIEELKELYHLPLLELISKAHLLHIQFHDPSEIQTCNLISIKTGGCPEDCKYCSQSSRYQTPTKAQPMMQFEEVINHAKKAIDRGASGFVLLPPGVRCVTANNLKKCYA